MDPITTAILAAISARAITGVTKAIEQLLVDAYNKLKELLGKKFGSKSKVVKAVKDLEVNPKSEARKAVMKEEVFSLTKLIQRHLILVWNICQENPLHYLIGEMPVKCKVQNWRSKKAKFFLEKSVPIFIKSALRH